MAQVQQVAPPQRRARTGGIKSVVGEFVREDRLAASTAIVWEDSGCGMPRATRAGCYDTVFPVVYDDIVIVSGDTTITLSRVGFEVTAAFVFGDTFEGATIAWAPTGAVSESYGGGTVAIGADGVITITGITAGSTEVEFTTASTEGAHYPLKTADGVAQFEAIGPAFARYAGVECFVGGDAVGPSYLEQARTLLTQGEDRAVEAVLWGWIKEFTTPGTATSLTAAIAAADQHADEGYVGQPVIVISRGDADRALAEGSVVREGGALVTANGTPVIASSAVDSGSVGVIGRPEVYASSLVAHAAIEHTVNMAMAIAERVYAIGIDCDYRYLVTVTG